MNVSEWRNALLCAVLLMTMLDEELLGVVLLALLLRRVLRGCWVRPRHEWRMENNGGEKGRGEGKERREREKGREGGGAYATLTLLLQKCGPIGQPKKVVILSFFFENAGRGVLPEKFKRNG